MPHSKQQTNIIDLLIPLAALGLITFGIGNYGLYEPHESHFAMVGNEMVWREDWITPHLNGAPYLNKPPLLYWLIAFSRIIFGNTEFAARFPIALAGWLGIIIAGKWSKDLWGVTAYRITVLMLTVTLGWFLFSRQILIDVLLATLLLFTNYCLWKLLQKPRSWFYFFCFYSTLTLILLTKGLIGIFFITASYIAVTFFSERKNIAKQTKLPLGIILVLVLVLPWAWAIERANPGFWHYFIFNEHLARIFDRRFPPDYVVSQINPWGYLGITALWCFPWILFLPATCQFVWYKLTEKFAVNSTQEREAILLLSVGFILPILVFLPLNSRLIYYSIPAIPNYIILCSGIFSQQLKATEKKTSKKHQKNKFKQNLLFTLPGYLLAIVGIISLIGMAIFPQLISAWEILKQYSIVTSLITTVIATLTLSFLVAGIEILNHNYRLSFNTLVISLFILYSIITVGFNFYQDVRSSKNLVAIVEKNLPVGTLWIFEGSREIGAAGGLSYYLNQGKQIKQTAKSLANNPEIPLGLIPGKGTTVYRNVLVLEDGGENRLPPQFPGEKPSYLINKQQLQTYWNSNRPTVFITDFLRDFQNPQDPIDLNLPNNHGKPVFTIGKRQIYINQAAVRTLRRNSF